MTLLRGRVAGYQNNPTNTDINTFARTKFEGFPFANDDSSGVFEAQNREQWDKAKESAKSRGTSAFQEYKSLTNGNLVNPLEQEMVGRFFGEVRKYGPPVTDKKFSASISGARK
jgi:hypothetical protein